LSGFIRPPSGKAVFRGVSILGLRTDRISGLGLVRTFQQPEIFASYTPRQICELVLSSIGAFGCGKEFNAALPDDPKFYLDLCCLSDVADRGTTSLSYGQTRLVGVAAALARRPFMLMLDEPAAGLTQSDRYKLAQVLLTARATGVTIILVDHDMSFLLPLCHRLTVLDYGKVICEGDPGVVCENEEVIAAYLGSGFAAKHRLATATASPLEAT
jgi:ABC-type branched-subunit amino acid transport system ATPase component